MSESNDSSRSNNSGGFNNTNESNSSNIIEEKVELKMEEVQALNEIMRLGQFLINFSGLQGLTYVGSSAEDNYPQEFLELAEFEIKAWCKSKTIRPDLIRLTIKLWNSSTNGNFPPIGQIVEYLCNNSCFCIDTLNRDEKLDLLNHFVISFGTIPKCMDIQACIMFKQLHRQWPNEEELSLTINRILEFSHNQEDFHSKDKMLIPTSNLEHLKPIIFTPRDSTGSNSRYSSDTNSRDSTGFNSSVENNVSVSRDSGNASNSSNNADETVNCSICQDEIKPGMEIYKLTPCGHIYHAKAEECLEGHSIMDWLKTHRTCPNCKTEIKIEVADPPSANLRARKKAKIDP